MNEETIRQLALDTLYRKRLVGGKSIKSNQAGIDLAKCGPAAIPIIENVIEKEFPQLDEDIVMKFAGLNYLIGAYLVIGVRSSDNRVFEYTKKHPKCILYEFICCSSTFFYKKQDGEYNFGVAPNKSLTDFLERHSNSDDAVIANIASKCLAQAGQ